MKRPWLLPVCLVLLAVAATLWIAPPSFLGNSKAQTLFSQGTAAAERGDLDTALARWENSVRIDPSNTVIWDMLSQGYLKKNDTENAIRCLLRIAEIAPDTPGIHGKLAIAFLSVQREQAAFEEAELELKRNPDHAPSLGVVAAIAGTLGMGDERLRALEKLSRLQPNDIDFLAQYCEMLLELNRNAEARPMIERFRRLAPQSHLGAIYAGMLLFRTDTSPAGCQAAITLFEQAMEQEPDALFPRLYLGKIYMRLRQPEKALVYLEVAAKQMHGKMDIQFELANAYAMTRQKDKSAEARKRFQALRDQTDRMQSLLKRCALERQNFDLFKETGIYCLQVGSFLNARICLNHAENLKPGDPEIRTAWQDLTRREAEQQAKIQQITAERRTRKGLP